MQALGILCCLLGFAIVIYMSYKNFSPFIASMVGALFVILTTGSPLVETLTGVYFPKLAGFISGYFGIFLLGSILARIYADSGAALSVAEGVMHLLVKESSSENRRQLMALIVGMLMTGILGLGGIITSVAVIVAYPLCLAVFKQADVPKRFSFCALALGAYTWVCTMPGSPQVTNIIPTTYLQTTGTALLVPGLIGAAVQAVLGILLLNRFVTKAKKAGEHFSYGPRDVQYKEGESKPMALLALIPLVLLFVLFNVFKVNINLCLLISVLSSLVLFFPNLKENGIKQTLNTGAINALAPMCTVGAIVGFANCVTITDAFGALTGMLFALPISPVILVIVFCGIIAGLTGGSATGFAVSLPILIPVLIEQMGVSPEMIHRVGLFAGTAISMLPYSGVILMFLPMSDLTLKDIYKPVFFCCLLSGLAATITVALCYTIGL